MRSSEQKSHIELAHEIWQAHVTDGDTVIDATCGNGHDTRVLAELTPSGRVFACDIQPDAIKKTKQKLKEFSHITYLERCHSSLPGVTPSLIVYNLGYLPGGDKSKTTMTKTTLKSIDSAIAVLKPGGLISITLYPGHEEGAKEAEAVLAHIRKLTEWTHEIHEPSEKPTAPKLLLLRQEI